MGPPFLLLLPRPAQPLGSQRGSSSWSIFFLRSLGAWVGGSNRVAGRGGGDLASEDASGRWGWGVEWGGLSLSVLCQRRPTRVSHGSSHQSSWCRRVHSRQWPGRAAGVSTPSQGATQTSAGQPLCGPAVDMGRCGQVRAAEWGALEKGNGEQGSLRGGGHPTTAPVPRSRARSAQHRPARPVPAPPTALRAARLSQPRPGPLPSQPPPAPRPVLAFPRRFPGSGPAGPRGPPPPSPPRGGCEQEGGAGSRVGRGRRAAGSGMVLEPQVGLRCVTRRWRVLEAGAPGGRPPDGGRTRCEWCLRRRPGEGVLSSGREWTRPSPPEPLAQREPPPHFCVISRGTCCQVGGARGSGWREGPAGSALPHGLWLRAQQAQ